MSSRTDATSVPADALAYRPAEAVRVSGISRSRLYELIASGDIPAKKLGGCTLILRESLMAYLASLPGYGDAA